MAIRIHVLWLLCALCLLLSVTTSISMDAMHSADGLLPAALVHGRRLLSDREDEDEDEDENENEGGSRKSPPPKSPLSTPPPPSKNQTATGKGDPHFTGADGSHFDFSGVPNNSYCLLTDSHLHVNAWFGGYYGQYEENPHKALTWMRKIGVLWGHHTILLEAREGAAWEYGSGYMAAIVVDGERVILSQAGDSATFADGSILIRWESAREKSGDDEIDVYSLRIGTVLSLKMELRPEVAALRTETDGTVHFDLYFPETRLSQSVHGVLGQTFRPDHSDRLSQQKLVFNSLLNTEVVPGDNAAGFLDGAVEDYKSSDMLVADCRVSRFSRSSGLDAETATAIELSMTRAGAPAVVSNSGLPRKMLLAGF